MTVVLDYETGRVVWLGEGRRFETLGAFFKLMTFDERRAIEAVAMDMWKPYARRCAPICRGLGSSTISST
jgi:transposase